MLSGSIPELPPQEAVRGVTPWKRAMNFVLVGMALGTVLLYILGTAWFCLQSGTGLADAVAKCVWIFLPGDFLKMAAALLLGPVLRRRLAAAGLLSGAREG